MKFKWKVFFFLLLLVLPLFLAWYMYVKDIASAIAFIYFVISFSALIFNWPKLEWLGYNQAKASSERKKSNKLTIKHLCNGKKGEPEYVEYRADEICSDKNLSSYQITQFWLEESEGLIKDIRGSLIHSIMGSAGVLIIIIFLNGSSGITKVSDWHLELGRVMGAVVAFCFNITYFYAICHFVYKRNIKV